MKYDVDIVISGGGVAGLTAACLFGTAGFSVICVDPTPPVTTRDAQGSDLRSTAFLQPSVPVLEKAGLWHRFSDHAMPLQTMRIIDAAGPDGQPRITRDFNAADISEMPFGWNLPNWLIRRELMARLDELPNVDFRPGIASTGLFTRTTSAKVRLSDGSTLSAKLVIAADGRGSSLREAAGIGVKTKRYGQKALAFAVTHALPHNNVSTEIHRSGGPFTLVPLPDYQGQPSSAIVWMEHGGRAQQLYDLDIPAFEAAMNDRSCNLLGPLTLASRRTLWPIISQVADRFSAQRLALVAEAAHVVPPIGAQGLNMSLADLDLLLELSKGDALGGEAALTQYSRRRRPEVQARITGIDLLNRVSMSGLDTVTYARSLGIRLLHDTGPIRKGLMQLGMGVSG